MTSLRPNPWLTLPLLMAAVGVGAGSPAPDAHRVDRLTEASLGDRLPPGWETHTVRGAGTPESRVTEVAGLPSDAARAIRFEATDEAAFFWLELAEPLDPERETIRWHWRVEEAIEGAVLRTPELDDAPARFFVVFGTGGLFSSPEMLFYSWGGSDQIGDHWTHPDEGKFKVMVRRNGQSAVGRWLRETPDLAADYVRSFGSEPALVTAIGFVIDTDQTGSRAVSMLGPVERVPKHGTPLSR